MMQYLQSYDRSRKRIGILVDAYDVTRLRRINSDDEMAFFVPMNSEDFRSKIQLKGQIKDERGQFYTVNSIERVRDGQKLTAAVKCKHVMFNLREYKIPYASYIKELYGAHISQLTDRIAAATGGRFSFVIHDTFDLYDIKDWGRTNCLAALNDVLKMYNAEIEADNYTLHIRKKIGADHGHQYRLQKNIVSSKFSDTTESLVTRLYVQMKDGRTWIGQPATILTAEERARLQAIPGAIVNGILQSNYLVSQYADVWASPDIPYYDGELIEQDITDVAELLRSARKTLTDNEIPSFEVDVSAADLHKLDRTETQPGLGDTVHCLDPALGLDNVTARVVEITEYPFAMDKHSQVKVANVMRKDFAEIMADLERAKGIVNNMTSGGLIRTELFEAFAKEAVIDVNNSKTEVKYDTRGIVLQDKTDARNQVIMTSNGIILTTDGGATARTAITPKYINAEVISGQLGSFVSLLIGDGNNVTQINTNGIAAGNTTFSSAPFRVDMQGNVTANKLTANSAQINTSNLNSSTWKDGYFSGNITAQGTITGANLIGGSITSNTDINVTRDARIGNVLYMGLTGQTNDRRIEFVDGGVYRSYIGFTNSTKQLEVYGANDVRISSGLDITLSAMSATLPAYSYIGSPTESNRIVVTSQLAGKADTSALNNKAEVSEAGYSLAFDATTRNLKMYSRTGQTLATVNIPK
ncbi:phage tail protein [Paenibacillus aceti]|uniref:Tail spike domain-containing protein n=1 Tax=Paenibacillus aceti TaxID=1820010 RepID=A0ABQ1W695_9BACL|nr:phage tail protein [Paenibacillus aceti]GGG15793.1 hypothetical protein GCM10010913_42230 [Paenibacillus aceti]